MIKKQNSICGGAFAVREREIDYKLQITAVDSFRSKHVEHVKMQRLELCRKTSGRLWHRKLIPDSDSGYEML